MSHLPVSLARIANELKLSSLLLHMYVFKSELLGEKSVYPLNIPSIPLSFTSDEDDHTLIYRPLRYLNKMPNFEEFYKVSHLAIVA